MKKKYNKKETLDETYEIDYDLFTVEEIIKIIQFYQLMGQYKNNKVSKQKIKEAYLEYKNIINNLSWKNAIMKIFIKKPAFQYIRQ